MAKLSIGGSKTYSSSSSRSRFGGVGAIFGFIFAIILIFIVMGMMIGGGGVSQPQYQQYQQPYY